MDRASNSIDKILEQFDPHMPNGGPNTTLTVWVPVQVKEAYDALQRSSRRRFSGTLRAVIMAAIDTAKRRTG